MTRCLNCGAERLGDICDACGLSSTAAEFSLRRSLLNRTALFLVGAIAFIVASGRYPALELDGIVIFIGVVFFLTLGLAIVVERRALRHQEVESLKRVYYGLLPLPWLLAVLLYANGALDRSPAHIEKARVISRFSMTGPSPAAASSSLPGAQAIASNASQLTAAISTASPPAMSWTSR